MRKYATRSVVAIFIALVFIGFSHAEADTKNVVFINGIQNTKIEAQISRQLIENRLTLSPNHTATSKRVFSVYLIWNPIGFAGSESGCDLCQDKKELFVEKVAEEKFADDFAKILAPHNQSTVIDKAAALRVKAYLDDMTPCPNSFVTDASPCVDSLETSGAVMDTDMAASQLAVKSLLSLVKDLRSAIIVAHSQGNLLANLAWASYASEIGNDIRKRVRVINVANTSKFSVNNLNLTHGLDAALFSAAADVSSISLGADVSLETLPSQYSNWKRITPVCANSACNFYLKPATFGGVKVLDRIFRHRFAETYLSSYELPVVLEDQGVNFTSNKIAFIDRFEDFVYAATLSLDMENSTQTRDIWTTSVYSFASGGGGPGGGLNDDQLIVGGWGDEYRSLVQFDLSLQPRVASSVRLVLYDISTHSGSGGPTPMFLYRIMSPWDWMTQLITPSSPDNLRLWWINQPTAVKVGASGSRGVLLPAPVVGQSYEIDITDIYNAWQADTASNFGLELRPAYTSNYWNVFASSENATPTWRPQLIITP